MFQLIIFLSQVNSILANLSSKKKPSNSKNSSKLRYKCSHCTMEFDKPSLCSRHERVHTGERPFKVSQIKQFPPAVLKLGPKYLV